MKSIFVIYNQVLANEIFELIDDLGVRGFTRWKDLQGRGSETGEPHMGTHTWPALNGALMCVVEDEQVQPVLDALAAKNDEAGERGLRAFVSDIEQAI